MMEGTLEQLVLRFGRNRIFKPAKCRKHWFHESAEIAFTGRQNAEY
jgi:hypothetical protein